jgi:selenocysteine lyase/cysteine desulfurase
VTIASVQGDGHYLRPDEGAFEDGTLNYLDIPSVGFGLEFIETIGRDAIHTRVDCLTRWLLDALRALRHRDGRSVVHIHGPADDVDRGGTIAFLVRDREGRVVDDGRVEELANRAHISLRTGCFCNPGAGEVAHGLGAREMVQWFGNEVALSTAELRAGLLREHDREVAAIRISVGAATNFADVYRFMCFLQRFVDQTVDHIARDDFMTNDSGGHPWQSTPPCSPNPPSTSSSTGRSCMRRSSTSP